MLDALPVQIRDYLLGTVKEARSESSGQIASLLDAKGSVEIDVVYHGEPRPQETAVPSTGEPATADACTLITDAEIVAILGVPISRHERADGPPLHSCVIGTPRQPLDGMTMADVSYVSITFGTGNTAMLHDGEENEAPVTPMTGIGDAAEFIDVAGAIIVQYGTNVLLIQVVQGGAPASIDVVIGVAELALSRLT